MNIRVTIPAVDRIAAQQLPQWRLTKVQQLVQRGYSADRISELTGVSIRVVERIKNGEMW